MFSDSRFLVSPHGTKTTARGLLRLEMSTDDIDCEVMTENKRAVHGFGKEEIRQGDPLMECFFLIVTIHVMFAVLGGTKTKTKSTQWPTV